jgi:anti-sigma factor RsiW
MNCSLDDVKAYFLNELPPAERALVEKHTRLCTNCREELERLNLTGKALLSLEDEEPRRIAFVSDKVFEPRWFEKVWRSGPVLGFASAVLLAAAILVHAYARPVVAPQVAASVDSAQIEQRIERDVNARLDGAVARAVSETMAREDQKIATVLDAAEKRYEFQRQADLAAAQQTIAYYEKKMNRWLVASNEETRLGQ